VGSANLSQSAWGALEQDKKMNEATCNTKLVKLSNFECGVVIPGQLVESLLEPGTESWQSGIVSYVQTGKRYDLPKDRPWNGKNHQSSSLRSVPNLGTELEGSHSQDKIYSSAPEIFDRSVLIRRQILDGFKTIRRIGEDLYLEFQRPGINRCWIWVLLYDFALG
jgi:hypothetical protein